jgi:hypothetical protein
MGFEEHDNALFVCGLETIVVFETKIAIEIVNTIFDSHIYFKTD